MAQDTRAERLYLLNKAGHAPKLPSTPGAGQNQQALRWNNGSGVFEYFTPGGGAGGGDVSGGGSSTDNAIVRWNGTAGTTVQDSNVTLSDDGSFAGIVSLQLGQTSSNVAATPAQAFYIDDGTNYEAGAIVAGTTNTPLVAGKYLQLGEQDSSPGTPSSGFARLYAKTDGLPYWKDDAGVETGLTRHRARPLDSKRGLTWTAQNATVYSEDIITTTGTLSFLADSAGVWTNFQTRTSGTFNAKISSNHTKWTQISANPRLEFRIKTGSDITGTRLWFVIASNPSASGFATSDDPGGHYVGIRYSTFASDSGWKAVCDNNAGQNVQAHSSIVADTVYEGFIQVDSTAGEATVNINGTEVVLSSALPSSATDLAAGFSIAAADGTNRRDLLFGAAYLESD